MLLVASVLATPLPWQNENRTLDLLKAMAQGKLTIDEWVKQGSGGETVDKALFEGHYYCGGAPGLAFFLYPVHEVARRVVPDRLIELVLVLFGSALPLALGAVAVKRAVESATGASEERALLAGAIHGLATIALPFATRLYAHSLETALVACSLAVLLSSGKESSTSRSTSTKAMLGGFLAASAVVCDYNVVFAAFALFVLAAMRGGVRGALAFSLGVLPPAVLLGVYQHECFGAFWHTPYDHHAEAATASIVAGGRYGFVAPSPRIFFALLFGWSRGFLWTQPAALLGFVGLAASAASARGGVSKLALATVGPAASPRPGSKLAPATAGLAWLATLAILLAHAARIHDWHAGCSFGARYSITALPFLALGYPFALELLGKLAWPVLAASFFCAFVGATNDWGPSMLGDTGVFMVLGPRARGLNELFLGSGWADATTATALLAAFALSVALPVAFRLIFPRPRRTDGAHGPVSGRASLSAAPIALFLFPWLASLPFHERNFMTGEGSHAPGSVYAAFLDVIRADVARRIDDASEPGEALMLAGVAANWKLPDLYLTALERAALLSPRDPRLRALLDAERKRFGREERHPGGTVDVVSSGQ